MNFYHLGHYSDGHNSVHNERIGRESVMIDATTRKVIDFSHRTSTDIISCSLLK